MKKKFITNLALLLFLNLLIKPFWIFGIDRAVQVYTGETEYGLYFSLFQLSVLLNVFLDLGIKNFNNRDIAQHNQLLSKYLSNIFGMKIILAFLYFIIIFLIAAILKYNERQVKLLIVLALNQFISVFILYLRSNISALHYFKIDSLISVLDRFLMIVFCSILLWGNVIHIHFTVEVFAYIQTFSFLLTFLIAFLFVLSKSDFFRIRFDRNYILALLKKIYPFALLTLLMGMYSFVDAVMLERLLPDGKFQTGVYAQSYRIFNAFWMFGLLYAGLLLPMFAKMIKNKEPVGQLTQLSVLLLVIPASLLVIACIFFKNEIFDLLYPGHTAESPLIFAILISGFIALSVSNIFGTLLTANGSIKELNIMAAIGMILNIVLNLILIPHFKALGSAIASLVTQFLTAFIQVLLAYHIFKFQFNYKTTFLYIAFFAGILILGSLKYVINISWYYEMLGFLIISAIFAVSIKVLDIKSFYKIIKFGDN